jgi:hypothetical protein
MVGISARTVAEAARPRQQKNSARDFPARDVAHSDTMKTEPANSPDFKAWRDIEPPGDFTQNVMRRIRTDSPVPAPAFTGLRAFFASRLAFGGSLALALVVAVFVLREQPAPRHRISLEPNSLIVAYAKLAGGKLMNARWLIPVVVVIGALSFAAGQRCVTAGEPTSAGIFGNTAALEKMLKLTPQQAEQARVLAKEFETKAGGACDKHCEARCDLARKLFRENVQPEELKQSTAEMCAAYAEQENATLEHLTKLRAILTPEQARVLDQKFAACICEKCAGGSGSCCRAEK